MIVSTICIFKQLYPLFDISPGEDNMQVDLDMSILDIDYSFMVNLSQIENLSKVAIKFLYESEIKEAISSFLVHAK